MVRSPCLPSQTKSSARSGHHRPYAPEVVSGGSSRAIEGQSGIGLAAARCYDEVRDAIDTLLVSGALANIEPAFRAWFVERAREVRRLGSVCTGAFVLADAGLLRGRRAAIHWAFAEEQARRHRDVAVDPAPIWIEDGNVTSPARSRAMSA